jgi:SAM-dependent methyltransferase
MAATEHGQIAAQVADYYSAKVREHGATHRGVDWNSPESQELRFRQLLRVCEGSSRFSILDFGCGYGALARFLHGQGYDAKYVGYDLSQEMLASARQHTQGLEAEFTSELVGVPAVDFAVASGVFNVRLGTSEAAWRAYLLDTLAVLDRLGSRGFAFNVLTRNSDPDRRRADLYYADPLELFEHCRVNFSRHVALLHDYGLYEFTLLVRKPFATAKERDQKP